jgi:hypothetical protein
MAGATVTTGTIPNAMAALGEAILVGLAVPLAILVVGAPIVLLVRLIVRIVNAF